MRAMILAAGAGNRLRGAFDDPKCLIPIGSIPILGRYVEALALAGVCEIVLVLGYCHEKVLRYLDALKHGNQIRFVYNPDFARGSILSLWAARDWLRGDILLMDGDLFFGKDFFHRAMNSEKKDYFFIDPRSSNDGEAVMVGFNHGRAVSLSRGLRGNFDFFGEWAGALKLSAGGSKLLREIAEMEIKEGRLDQGYEFVVPRLFDRIIVSYEAVNGAWLEIDFPEDMNKAERICREMEEASSH